MEEKLNNIQIKCKLSPIQHKAWELLEDNVTTEILFGGGAGGGKSRLGCSWLIYSCMLYPATRWMMARAVLKDLKASTLLTFFEVCRAWGFKLGEDYEYNDMKGIITFNNGSQVFLKDLQAYPSDPEFDSLGSTEYTGVFIDEASQTIQKAKNIATSRIRYKLDEYGLIPKTLICSNPSKNFLYKDFYRPYVENILPPYRRFIKALAIDNPFITPYYVENLKKLPKSQRERLLNGNWEYDDDVNRLFEYDDLLDIFTNNPETGDKYISVDVARFGEDKTVLMIWDGLHVKKIIYKTKQSTKETRELIELKAREYNIPHSHIIIDEDGVGGGIKDEMGNIKGFVNNHTPLLVDKYDKEKTTTNYTNLKSQCYFYLSDYVKKARISISGEIDSKIKEYIIEELEQIKAKDIDKDGKLAVVGKEVIKENIGRSPDFADALMMRMYFEINKSSGIAISGL